jgi:hypothetical protein
VERVVSFSAIAVCTLARVARAFYRLLFAAASTPSLSRSATFTRLTAEASYVVEMAMGRNPSGSAFSYPHSPTLTPTR